MLTNNQEEKEMRKRQQSGMFAFIDRNVLDTNYVPAQIVYK